MSLKLDVICSVTELKSKASQWCQHHFHCTALQCPLLPCAAVLVLIPLPRQPSRAEPLLVCLHFHVPLETRGKGLLLHVSRLHSVFLTQMCTSPAF